MGNEDESDFDDGGNTCWGFQLFQAATEAVSTENDPFLLVVKQLKDLRQRSVMTMGCC